MSKLTSDKLTSEAIPRRTALSILGLAALVLALPGAVLTASDAEAQAQPPAPEAPETGTERRQERRTGRVGRRSRRRAARRRGREERRELRHDGAGEKGAEEKGSKEKK
jgi:hypothetical protein